VLEKGGGEPVTTCRNPPPYLCNNKGFLGAQVIAILAVAGTVRHIITNPLLQCPQLSLN